MRIFVFCEACTPLPMGEEPGVRAVWLGLLVLAWGLSCLAWAFRGFGWGLFVFGLGLFVGLGEAFVFGLGLFVGLGGGGFLWLAWGFRGFGGIGWGEIECYDYKTKKPTNGRFLCRDE